MKIEKIDVFRVAMPLIYPFRTAFGNDAAVETILVRMTSGAQYGWGEASPWKFPAYSPESGAGAFLTVREFLAPRLLGADVKSGAQLQELLSVYKGNHFAKAALDLAWWDLYAKSQGQPLYKVLGGNRTTVDVGADFGVMENIDLLVQTVGGAVQAGFKRIKLKYRPGWELDMIAAVRKSFPDTVIHVDCNSAYTLRDLDMFKKLDRYNLAMIEQPLMSDDLIDHAELQKNLNTPLCLDESITSVNRARKAAQVQACRWVNIKPGRVGGLTNALAIHNVCADAGIPCWVGGMLESALGARHCLALATLPNFKYPADVFPTSRFFKEDLARPEMVLSGKSQMTVSQSAGVGAEPVEALLKKQTIEKTTLRCKEARRKSA
jgi:O-succinylbenzoate synthase